MRNIAPNAKICVDDVDYANQNFTNKDILTYFTSFCNDGSNDNDLKNIVKIHPVPFIDKLTIKGVENQNDSRIYIYSASGKQFSVKKTIIDNESLSFDLNKIPKGVYFVKIIVDNQVIVKKIIKK